MAKLLQRVDPNDIELNTKIKDVGLSEAIIRFTGYLLDFVLRGEVSNSNDFPAFPELLPPKMIVRHCTPRKLPNFFTNQSQDIGWFWS